MTVIGTAELLIKAVDSGIESDIKRKVDRAVSKADKTVKITADTKSAEASISRLGSVTRTSLDDITSRLTSGLGPASGEAKAALDGLTKSGSLIGPAIAGGVAIAGAAVAAFAIDGAQKFVALAGEIRNFQRVSGASAEESSRFVAVLDDLGVSAQTGGNAIFLLSKKIAAGGDDLRKLGIDVATTKDGTADLTETLLNVADAYAAQPDPAKRAEIAFAGFGRQGKELIPVLEQGREGLKRFFESAEGGRQIFSQEDLDKARRFELAMDDLSDTFRGLQLEAGEALLPFLTSLATAGAKVIEFGNTVKDKVGGAIGVGLRAVAGIATAGASEGIRAIFNKLSDGGDKAKKSQKELAEQAKLTAAAQQEEAEASREQAEALDKVTNATLSAVSSQLGYQSSLNTLKDNINDIDDRTQDYTDAVDKSAAANKEAEKAVRLYGAGSDEAKEATDRAKDAAKDAEQANRALRDAHLGVEQSALQTAGAAVKLAEDVAASSGKMLTAQEKSDIFKAALISLANQADGPTKTAILTLAEKITTLPDHTVTVDADTGAAHSKLDSLENRMSYLASKGVSLENDTNLGTAGDPTARASGGPVFPGRLYLVGEKRPELFVPDVAGRIIPNVSNFTGTQSTSTFSGTLIGQLVVQAPNGNPEAIGAAVKRAVTQLVADGTVGRAMSKRSESQSRR